MKIAHIGNAGGLNVGVAADHVAVIGMLLGKQQVHHLFVGHTVGPALALAALVAHHVPLIGQQHPVEPLHQETHAVALQPQRQLQLVRGHGLEVIRAVEVGGAVHVRGARALHNLDVRLLAHVLRALEHHVLKQMRKPGTTRPLVERAHVVPEIDRHQRQPVILMRNHGQAVRQRVFGKRDLRQLVLHLRGRNRCGYCKKQEYGQRSKQAD